MVEVFVSRLTANELSGTILIHLIETSKEDEARRCLELGRNGSRTNTIIGEHPKMLLLQEAGKRILVEVVRFNNLG